MTSEISRKELQAQLYDAGLERYAAVIAEHARLAIVINRTVVQDESEIAISESKFGGRPDVPADFEWPYWKNIPLTFLAQFRLSDVKPYDVDDLLPDSGMLYFFYETDEIPYGDAHQREGHRVFFHPDEIAETLTRIEHPIAQAQYHQIEALPAAKLSFKQNWTFPTLEYLGHTENIDWLKWDKSEYDAYWEICKKHMLNSPYHQLLGQPYEIQGDVRYETHDWSRNENIPYSDSAIDDEHKINEWLLLFEVDTDDGEDGLGVIWGDVGMLYFMITTEALKHRQFDSTWCIMQCS